MRSGGFEKAAMSARFCDIAKRALGKNQEKSWWQQSEASSIMRSGLECGDIRRRTPTEQYVIGKSGVGIRFFNFGERLSPESVAELRKYTESSSQWLGMEQSQDLVSDVICAPIRRSGNADTLAFRHSALPGAVFIDTDELSMRQDGLIQWALLHELGHYLHGELSDADRSRRLARFAFAVGWRRDQLSNVNTGRKWTRLDAPDKALSDYAKTHPAEVFADVTARIMVGEDNHTMITSEGLAWLEYVREDGHGLATAYPGDILIQERRTGKEILFPGGDMS